MLYELKVNRKGELHYRIFDAAKSINDRLVILAKA